MNPIALYTLTLLPNINPSPIINYTCFFLLSLLQFPFILKPSYSILLNIS